MRRLAAKSRIGRMKFFQKECRPVKSRIKITVSTTSVKNIADAAAAERARHDNGKTDTGRAANRR